MASATIVARLTHDQLHQNTRRLAAELTRLSHLCWRSYTHPATTAERHGPHSLGRYRQHERDAFGKILATLSSTPRPIDQPIGTKVEQATHALARTCACSTPPSSPRTSSPRWPPNWPPSNKPNVATCPTAPSKPSPSAARMPHPADLPSRSPAARQSVRRSGPLHRGRSHPGRHRRRHARPARGHAPHPQRPARRRRPPARHPRRSPSHHRRPGVHPSHPARSRPSPGPGPESIHLPLTSLNPTRPAPDLLDTLLYGIHTCWRLYQRHDNRRCPHPAGVEATRQDQLHQAFLTTVRQEAALRSERLL
ncbi:hypothetical protein ACFQ0B_66930 [Nonomuraea thailandensis]